MISEIHNIKPFRDTKLGVIRLNKLANPRNMKIFLGEREVSPIGFDTYGHPILSEEVLQYYFALKTNADRRNETFLVDVEYEEAHFFIKSSYYDSKEELAKILNGEPTKKLEKFKEYLVMRKKAAFIGKKLNVFALNFDNIQYILASDGKIYLADYLETTSEETILAEEDMEAYVYEKEVHIPSSDEKCKICGKEFSFEDVENGFISFEAACKVHLHCAIDFAEQVEEQKACSIVDAVYLKPKAPVTLKKFIDAKGKERNRFVFKTEEGDISIYFKTKVIVIEWGENYKPFQMDIFENERVTKYDDERGRGIHAWSASGAIKYLDMAKRA